MKIGRTLYFAAALILVVLSFFLYSSRYYPLLSSDDALNVLMTYYYRLPHDIYCWGQDRGGTLIPLISQVFHRWLGFSPIVSVSFSNYLVLILGYWGFSSLLKNSYTKLLFAIVWFFPPIRFVDLTRFPIGVQYSLIGFSIYLINKVRFNQRNRIFSHVLMVLVVLILCISVWVSDLSLVSITLLIFTLFFFRYREIGKLSIPKSVLFYIVGGVAGVFFMLRFAKRHATGVTGNYLGINTWAEFWQAVETLVNEFLSVYTFQNDDIIFSIYAWFVMISLLFLAFCVLRSSSFVVPERIRPWLAFFILDFVVVLGGMAFSKWVLLNGMGRWYFVSSYISLSLVVLILLDNNSMKDFRNRAVHGVIALTILLGAVSTPHYLKFVRPKTLKSKVDIKREFLTLGEIGIIGEFWNSYISACPNPSILKATAHDKSVVRNKELVNEVFAQPEIYVIRDMWMKSFPDSLKQFGHTLVRDGEPFKMAGCDVCKYADVERD
ncbi:hypothetical protein SAMN05444274_1117 [Mariniphaga anaerophila]|uniref:4-amino-4-deoxy-L-arabinose transferase n=1 Tax=Mariniphaga anaerophila TaxID=1484053 RepID=A0A1M5F3V8_9BACT|nr:hypothetical protein [Mariniphaga anaerophila]SHF86207.1 hypothetical protein SAMN05444274_1117 [Mariniphaga anaerophila]